MAKSLEQLQQLYAELLVKIGANLQVGQCLRIGGELAHAEFVRQLVAEAYKAGAKYVHVDWLDTPSTKARLVHGKPELLDYMPEYEIQRHDQMLSEVWARIALVGDEFPEIYSDVDPSLMRRMMVARQQKLKAYSEAQAAMKLQWCVAGVPTVAWAQRIFPTLSPNAAVRKLWQVIFKLARIDQPDPIQAWREHVQNLGKVVAFMADRQIQTIKLFDPTLVNGKPATNLTIGLTDGSFWAAGSAYRPDGIEFLPNMPTEEVFASPHRMKVEGWVRTSKPCFPLDREVRNAWFHFEDGEVTQFGAEVGEDVLAQFFEIAGARRLGEIALVDVRSPVNRSKLIFFDTLFDENAVCHIAFGRAYTDIVKGADAMSEEEQVAFGINSSDTHVDFMVGTPTMDVSGVTASGKEVAIMKAGKFTSAVLQ